jgi:hypothetical protein
MAMSGLAASRRLCRLGAALIIAIFSGAAAGPRAGSAAAAGSGTVTRTDAAGTVWLCRPGLANDPCTANLDTTIVSAGGSSTVKTVKPAADPPVDCFYVYPTVSGEMDVNADLRVQPAETSTAIAQAARFSQVCRVWAPMYRQRTLISLAIPVALTEASDLVAYNSALAGWKDYLAHYNDGRPIVFLGHSQGASILIELLRTQIDPNPALRRRMVSAIILGGNVTVPLSASATGSFRHIPACSSARQTGCVIAYSSFPSQPPADSYFGRPGQGLDLLSNNEATKGLKVLCVNPAALGGGSGVLDPYYPVTALPAAGERVTTPWVEYPDQYMAVCRSGGGATWLQVTPVSTRGDPRPQVPDTDGPRWGFHVADVNLALGNLVSDVRQEVAAYFAAHPAHA